MTNDDNEKADDKHEEQSQALANTDTTDKHQESQGAVEESLKIQIVSVAKPEIEDFDIEVKTNKKIKPSLDFWENMGVMRASNSGVKNKEFPIKPYTGGNKTRGLKTIQARGTRVCKSKVKLAKKTPIKGKPIQTKINFKPIKINLDLSQTEQNLTSTDELGDKVNGNDAVD